MEEGEGVSLSGSKTGGGDFVSWAGFELIHSNRNLGISQRRAEWFFKWTREVGSVYLVNITSFEEGFGCVMYVAGAW